MSGKTKPILKKQGLASWQISLLSVTSGLFVWQMISDYIIANPLFLAYTLQVVTALILLIETG